MVSSRIQNKIFLEKSKRLWKLGKLEITISFVQIIMVPNPEKRNIRPRVWDPDCKRRPFLFF